MTMEEKTTSGMPEEEHRILYKGKEIYVTEQVFLALHNVVKKYYNREKHILMNIENKEDYRDCVLSDLVLIKSHFNLNTDE
jgi:hypothetical protein